MWQCGAYTFDTSKPLIMGILNVTPDSFSDGGLYYSKNDANGSAKPRVENSASPSAKSSAKKPSEQTAQGIERACDHARRMVSEGASIIDVGGESTRPGSDEVSTKEELRRVLPVVQTLASEGIAVSVDTRHAEVAAACIEQGAAVINDVSGFSDEAMRKLVQETQVGCIVMHAQGEPKTMQDAPYYDDVVGEVEEFLCARAQLLEKEYGVARARIALDPGPGFGKNFEHNKALLYATDRLASQGYPLVAAWSRKRFIGELAGVEEPSERVAGSVAVALFAAAQGARILRVHDVAQTAQVLEGFGQGAAL
ncbi:MAG: dihydropteroate synthase [Coriobacteriales bacterium]|jgi:dihydropteroate synthase|nr:dihydropteroate synthase [Coriobacteriales bacterium]